MPSTFHAEGLFCLRIFAPKDFSALGSSHVRTFLPSAFRAEGLFDLRLFAPKDFVINLVGSEAKGSEAPIRDCALCLLSSVIACSMRR